MKNNIIPHDGLSILPTQISLALTNNANRVIVRQATIEATHDQCGATLAKIAMENVGALSALEQHLYRTVPFGEARYKQIADAYALSAAARILRW